MRKIHPRTASAVFIILYGLIGLLIFLLFKINLFENKSFIVTGVIIVLIISIIFGNRYYKT